MKRPIIITVIKSDQGLRIGLCSNMLEFLLEFLWRKTLSAPSFGRYWKHPIGSPLYEAHLEYEILNLQTTTYNKLLQEMINFWNCDFPVHKKQRKLWNEKSNSQSNLNCWWKFTLGFFKSSQNREMFYEYQTNLEILMQITFLVVPLCFSAIQQIIIVLIADLTNSESFSFALLMTTFLIKIQWSLFILVTSS